MRPSKPNKFVILPPILSLICVAVDVVTWPFVLVKKLTDGKKDG
jgi:hypothetical protein